MAAIPGRQYKSHAPLLGMRAQLDSFEKHNHVYVYEKLRATFVMGPLIENTVYMMNLFWLVDFFSVIG